MAKDWKRTGQHGHMAATNRTPPYKQDASLMFSPHNQTTTRVTTQNDHVATAWASTPLLNVTTGCDALW